MRILKCRFVPTLMLFWLLLPPSVGAQCPGEWIPTDGVPGVSGGEGILCALTLPDGDVIVGGAFQHAGNTPASLIARWDGESWSPLGSGVGVDGPFPGGAVVEMALLPNGDLIVAGGFDQAGGKPANNVARWDGSSWSPLGLGVNGQVYALTVTLEGHVIVGGSFNSAGGAPASRLARWDGANWSAMGNVSFNNSVVNSVFTMPNGDILASGVFSGLDHIIRWDGAAWVNFARLNASDVGILDFAVLPNGDLIAAGRFSAVQSVPANNIARWDGVSWSALAMGLGDSVHEVEVRPDGDIIVGGTFRNHGPHIARWDGAAWSGLEGGVSTSTLSAVYALATFNGDDLFVGGNFLAAGGVPRYNAAIWDGAEYRTAGRGMDNVVQAFATLPDGDLVAGGAFACAGSGPANCIARWDGSDWHPLGAGFTGMPNVPPRGVRALAVLPNGDLVAGGDFQTPPGRIARWDGAEWHPLGSGIPSISSVLALGVTPDGDLIVGGSFTSAGGAPAVGIARWSNGAWSALGAGLNGTLSIAIGKDGTIFAGGAFPSPAGRVAMWNGQTWLPLGAGVNSFVRSMIILPDGDLVVAGSFTTAGGQPAPHIARWDGSQWFTMGDGLPNDVNALSILPGGHLVAASNAFGANTVHRWNGATWVPLLAGFNREVTALSVMPDGTLALGGFFTAVQGRNSPYFARWDPPAGFCRADFNCNGPVNSQDLFDFLSAFFASGPSADFNDDEVINSQDFFDFIASFFGPC